MRLRRNHPTEAVDRNHPTEAVERYNSERTTPHRDSICNAPLTNLYFAATGAVGPCWIQLDSTLRWGPDTSIRDIWTGLRLQHMRSELAAGRFPGACERCEHDIESGCRPLAAVYDTDDLIIDWPTSLELELSNLCNLECVMCNGDLSSKIRRNREGRPALDVPYDDTFVDQLGELIPTLRHLRFSGGEPMLHPIMYKICERVIELRPDLLIMISTNGSTLNAKVRSLLERARVQINISFESLHAERYEAIRVGADHAVLMRNIEEFRHLTAVNGGFVTINTNPMRSTWDEMAAIVRFCDDRGLHLSFNTVIQPSELSLRSLPAAELAAVHDALSTETFAEPTDAVTAWNHAQFANFVAQVDGWLTEAGRSSSDGTAVLETR